MTMLCEIKFCTQRFIFLVIAFATLFLYGAPEKINMSGIAYHGDNRQIRLRLIGFKKTVDMFETENSVRHEKLKTVLLEQIKATMDRYQADGNLDGYLEFEKALAVDGCIETDNAELSALYNHYEKALEQSNATRTELVFKAAQGFYRQIEYEKANATKMGNIDVAVQCSEYLGRLKVFCDGLKKKPIQPQNAVNKEAPQKQLQDFTPPPRVQKTQPSPVQPVIDIKEDDSDVLKAGTILTGTQKVPLVVLSGSYSVRDQYVIPEGAEVVIRKGSTLVFGPNSGLTVQGRLTCEGTEESVVYFKGKGAGLSSWQGLKFFGFAGSTIEYAHFTGAKLAIELSKAGISLSSCTFYRNEKALHTVGHHTQKSILENCMMTRNVNAISYHYAALDLINCTISDNEEVGIGGDYYGDIKLSRCIVTKNGKGIKDGGYDGTTEAHDCIIFDNKEYDVRIDSSQAGNFTGNWWGPRNTSVLQRKGTGIKLEKLQGNFINIADFLTQEPADCGAHNCPKIK